MMNTAPQRPPPPTLYRPDGLEMQLETAHRFKRDVRAFLAEAEMLATLSEEIARSCVYAVWRDGRIVVGPSVRLAEIVASSYGNLDVSTEVSGEDDGDIVSRATAWDLERNVRRRADAIAGKGAVATSIAYRNAVFEVVPRAYVDAIFSKVLAFAVGDASTLPVRREALLGRFAAMGVQADRLLARVLKESVEDVGVAELALLIGLETSLRSGEVALGEAFPEAEDVDGAELEAELRSETTPAQELPTSVYITNAKVDPPPPSPALDPTPPPAARAPRRPKATTAAAEPSTTAPAPESAAADDLFGRAAPPQQPPPCVVCKAPLGNDRIPTMGGERHPGCAFPAPAAAPGPACAQCGGPKHRYLNECPVQQARGTIAKSEPDDGEPPPDVKTVGSDDADDPSNP